MIINECERLVYKFGRNYDNEDYIAQCQQIQRNNDLINEIPTNNRIKVFTFSYDETLIQTLYSKIEKAREYYETLTMPFLL
jgi:hypothetical protein